MLELVPIVLQSGRPVSDSEALAAQTTLEKWQTDFYGYFNVSENNPFCVTGICDVYVSAAVPVHGCGLQFGPFLPCSSISG